MDGKALEKTAPALDGDSGLKEKYGKIYRIDMTIPEDDDHTLSFTYHFKRPAVASYDRYVKTASKLGITKASKVFLLDAVVEEDKARLTADMEEYPGVGITVGNKLTEILGLTDAANLKKL